jgi:anti-sigma-K factor RskA
MNTHTTDERLIMKYLLGRLSEEEQERIEDRFFTDDGFFEQVEITKDVLIEEYANNLLSFSERQEFEEYFLASRQGQQEFRIQRAINRYVSEINERTDTSEKRHKERPEEHHRVRFWWYPLRAILRGYKAKAVGGT